jgi:hypothetical protein
VAIVKPGETGIDILEVLIPVSALRTMAFIRKGAQALEHNRPDMDERAH